jgi:hypothetical protein
MKRYPQTFGSFGSSVLYVSQRVFCVESGYHAGYTIACYTKGKRMSRQKTRSHV